MNVFYVWLCLARSCRLSYPLLHPYILWLINVQPTAKYIAVRSLETWHATVAAHTQSTTVAKNHAPGYKNITMMDW